MLNHPYICLVAREDLNEDDLKSWIQSVEQAGPGGIIAPVVLKDGKTPRRYYRQRSSKGNSYVISLSRNLLQEEAAKIARFYDSIYPEKDFEINWSQNPQPTQQPSTIDEDALKGIALEAAKKSHNTWYAAKVNEGWRYGIKHNTHQKTSPMIRDWASLSDRYKKIHYHKMKSILETLSEMNLMLAKK
jgi:hypothetical protein